MPSYQVKQSSTAYPLVFLMIDSADHISGKTGLSPTVTISKAGAAFGSPTGAVTEIGSGWYKVAGNATDSGTLGPLALHATATGADPSDTLYEVVAHDVQDSVRLGLSALPSASAGASGGLLISGSNSGTTTLGALTVTGQFLIQDGVDISCTTSNRTAFNANGNGTGAGIRGVSGTGASGSGIVALAQSTNGNGISATASGSGTGIIATAGSTGYGMKLIASGSGAAALHLAGSANAYGLEILNTAADGFRISCGGIGLNVTAVGATSAAVSLTAGATSGDALTVATVSGHGFNLSGIAGSGKFGIKGTIDGAITSSGLATPTNITSATGIDVTKWSGTTVATPNTAGVPIVDTRELIRQGTAQSTGNSTTAIKLDSGASATTNYYKYMLIQVISGTGAPQAALCTAYDGSTKIATVAPAWPTAPDNTSVFQIFPAQTDLETIVGAAVSTSTAQLGVNVVTNADKTGYSVGSGGITSSSFAAGAIDASAIATDAIGSAELAASAVNEIVTAVWTDLLASADFSTSSSIGKLLKDDIDAAVSSRMATYTQPSGFLAATFPATVASTTNITSASGVTLTSGERNSIADSILTRDVLNVEGTANDHSLCYVVLASSEWSVSGTTLTVKKTTGATFATKTLTKTAGDDPVRGAD